MKNNKKERNLFELIPQISEKIEVQTTPDGFLQIVLPRFKSKFMQKYFVPKNKQANVYIKLEEHGTEVWKLIDGKRTVTEITELLANHFNNEAQYENRISTYIKQLHRSGFIKFLE